MRLCALAKVGESKFHHEYSTHRGLGERLRISKAIFFLRRVSHDFGRISERRVSPTLVQNNFSEKWVLDSI